VRLADPLRHAKPRLIFIDSMSELFHDSVAQRTRVRASARADRRRRL